MASLKLQIDTKSQKVIFAEAGKDFVDFLFNLMNLPLGTITQMITKQKMPPLTIPVHAEKIEKKFYGCSNVRKHFRGQYYSDCIAEDTRTRCNRYIGLEQCGHIMSTPLQIIPSMTKPSGSVGYVKDEVAFMVADDLAVRPLTTASIVALLKDVGELEEKLVYLDKNKGLKLLKASLESRSVLTSVFLLCLLD